MTPKRQTGHWDVSIAKLRVLELTLCAATHTWSNAGALRTLSEQCRAYRTAFTHLSPESMPVTSRTVCNGEHGKTEKSH
ncbi:hypothetical protein PM082_020932 [Marasmius tenuissimus]|nr:hypothetical protein PM082_020932 [Marasmius tenuissimus]